MKISYNWLRQYVKTGITAREAAELLTAAGLEVEAIEQYQSVKGGLANVVIGEVKTCSKHPNADRLSLTTVDVGNKVLLIVCGAPNVGAGQKVVVALQGAILHPSQGEPFTIKKSNIRGIASEGMICAEDEIGLGTSHAGIMVLPAEAVTGTPAAEYFGIYNDHILEINITPNRADAISHIGVARDLAAAIGLQAKSSDAQFEKDIALQVPAVPEVIPAGKGLNIQVEVREPAGCTRYSGIAITGIKVGESPQWLRNRLLAVSVRPINNIVDVTNFVMLETGQPLHAFDAGKIKGNKVIVRHAAAGETIVTLDGVARQPSTSDLLICNEKEAMCIAGVYGGIDSGVSAATTDIFIESACFNPTAIRKTARRLGLHTDSAYRYERGTDINGTRFALNRAVQLILEAQEAAGVSAVTDVYSQVVPERKIELSLEYVWRLAGCQIHGSEIEDIFSHIGITVEEARGDAMSLSIPTFRMDISCQADLVEEIIRFYGLNRIPASDMMKLPVMRHKQQSSGKIYETIANLLTVSGFTEIMNTSLTSSKNALPAGKNASALTEVKVANPLSADLDVLRSSLLQNGLQAIGFNQNRKNADIKFFEFGKIYSLASEERQDKEGSPFCEEERLGLWITGNIHQPNWKEKPAEADFYFLKGAVQRVIDRISGGESLHEQITANPQFKYGLTWYRQDAGQDSAPVPVADFGLVDAGIAERHHVKGNVFFAEFHWLNLLKLAPKTMQTEEIGRFPFAVRDLSLIIGSGMEFRKLEEMALGAERKLLRNVSVIDVYEGDRIGKGKKSYTLRFVLQNNTKTLTDAEIDQSMKSIIDTYEAKAGAVVRNG
ncbi:MAG: phenylalanine--tRNA ligase subunit beta [Bacteroidia bacterium]|nr:phenylalanine--tRNA ligase subunit beta [Bacteroidia bacterium]